MNKKIKLLLALFLSMIFKVGCNSFTKNPDVANVETLIDQIGTVTIDSWDEIESAETALNNLSGSDYEEVNNVKILEQAEEDFDAIIEDYNSRIEEARYLAEESTGGRILMRNISDGLNTIQEIRAELPDEVVDRYIVFNSDKDLDEWIEYNDEFLSRSCYPNTTVLKFDLWYYVTTGYGANLTTGNTGEFYQLFSEQDFDQVDYLWSVKHAYDDYVSSEGYSSRVTCGLVDTWGIDVNLR